MATGFRKILEGLRLIPKATSIASEAGDLDVAPAILQFAPSVVNTTTDFISIGSHGLIDGDAINFSSTGTLPSPLTPSTDYYVRFSTINQFQVSLTPFGSVVDLTSQGTGVHTIATVSKKLNYHDGISSSPIVTEYLSATLRNKILVNPTIYQGFYLNDNESPSNTLHVFKDDETTSFTLSSDALPLYIQSVPAMNLTSGSDVNITSASADVNITADTDVNITSTSGVVNISYSLFVEGEAQALAGIKLGEATTNAVQIQPNPTGSEYALILPPTQGAASTVLTNDGSGNLSWAAAGGGGGGGVSSITIDNGDFGPYTGNFDFQFIGGLTSSIIGSSPTAGVQVNNPYSWYPISTSVSLTLTAGSTSGKDVVILANASASDVIIQLPSPASVYAQKYTIKRTDINTINNTVFISTLTGSIDGQDTMSINKQYMSYTMISDGSNYYLI
jgi:hypothetical protein